MTLTSALLLALGIAGLSPLFEQAVAAAVIARHQREIRRRAQVIEAFSFQSCVALGNRQRHLLRRRLRNPGSNVRGVRSSERDGDRGSGGPLFGDLAVGAS